MVNSFTPSGLWLGDNGSELSLSTTRRGDVIGTYLETASGQSYPLSGFMQGACVVLSICVGPFDTVGAFRGVFSLDAKGAVLDATWDLFSNEGEEIHAPERCTLFPGECRYRPVADKGLASRSLGWAKPQPS